MAGRVEGVRESSFFSSDSPGKGVWIFLVRQRGKLAEFGVSKASVLNEQLGSRMFFRSLAVQVLPGSPFQWV